MSSPTRWTLIALLVVSAAACGTTRTGEAVDNELDAAMAYFKTRLNQDDAMEAYYIYEAMKSVDPDYPGLEASAQAFRDDNIDIVEYFDRGWLGSNFSLRMPTDRGIGPENEQTGLGSKLGWYLPDRLLDILDLVSFDVHFGLGAYVDVHATRIVKADLGVRNVAGVGWHNHRSLGILNQADATAGFMPFGTRAYTATQAGTSGVQTGSWSLAGMHEPTDDLYKEFVDYWAAGASATAGIVGVSVDLHPIEAFDMLAGWALFDPANDDFGRTRGNRLTDSERGIIKTLGQIRRSADEMIAYDNFKAAQEEIAVENVEIED
ncbi:MAG: hypothetical protein DRQ55_01245 [Planctomycetota bacterium]|nr:MAG: hypothetical protein DRQ55_01245 [Planctomycetota bacterium]